MKKRMKFLALSLMFSLVLSLGLPYMAQASEITKDELEDSEIVELPKKLSKATDFDESLVAAKGVSIEGVDISDKNYTGVYGVVEDIISGYDEVVFTLTANNKSVEAKGSDLVLGPVSDDVVKRAINYGKGGNIVERYIAKKDIESGKGKNFALSIAPDFNATREFLDNNKDELNEEAKDHGLKREGDSFTFLEGNPGVVVDLDKSSAHVSEYITKNWKGGDDTITLDVIKEEPKGSKEQLLAVKDLLGSCSTNFGSSAAGRASNIRLGTSRIDGSIVYPGDEFSVSDALGPRTGENGYYPAPSYENGTTVDTYGGGVCQISTTLYNAVIRSELEVVERTSHSMMVGYVKPSMDAAIAENSLDFRFKNNYDYPIYIEGYTSGPDIGFNIFGKEVRDSNRSVSFESETISTTEPQVQYVGSKDFPVGYVAVTQQPHTGCRARLWKIVTVNGKEESRKVFNESNYHASNTIITVGTTTENGEAAAAIAAAIATGDKATIEAAAAQWNDAALEQRTQEEANKEQETQGGDTPNPEPAPGEGGAE